eukprot:2589132-Pyramimonas_sp.AAC.1
MAPIRGFEHYVGKKTTFNIVNSHNVRELLQVRGVSPAPAGVCEPTLNDDLPNSTDNVVDAQCRLVCFYSSSCSSDSKGAHTTPESII